ncbi:hypothetical protein N7456_004869 [Penicillium angulare]|uniref:Uncharacterized protein n=1 Tax=Penicillium angulare TaxID=116970 RepID=A0A9W9KIS3_9EURO|nr:hypothetical protein N7456_004869 [Penicillium angulare]
MSRRCSLGCLLGCHRCRSPDHDAEGPQNAGNPEGIELQDVVVDQPPAPPPPPNIELQDIVVDQPPAPPPPNIVIRPRFLRPWESYQADGSQLRRWISNEANQPPCPINPSALSFAEAVGRLRAPIERREGVDVDDPTGQLREFGYSDRLTNSQESNSRWIHFNGGTFIWDGYIAQGMISLTAISRPGKNIHPPVSQLSQAIYQRDFNIDTLRHVFVWDITNIDTIQLISSEQLYGVHNGLQWPSIQRLTYDHGTAEYDALLGTRIGKVVAYLVLGAWPRGTRRISQITTCANTVGAGILRFDIEAVGRGAPAYDTRRMSQITTHPDSLAPEGQFGF